MKIIITIGRHFGSGGREAGEKLAKALNIPFYDEDIVDIVAREGKMHPDIVRAADEKATDSLLYSLITGGGLRGVSDMMHYEMPINDKVFMQQSKTIKEKAASGSGVFVGRCADYILEDTPELLRVFFYAPMEHKIERISRLYDVSEQKAKEMINKKEKSRKTFYNYYTDRSWGNPASYDLCINTGSIDLDSAVELIKAYVEKRG